MASRNGNQINFWEDPWLINKLFSKTKFGYLRYNLKDMGGTIVADYIGLVRKWKKMRLQKNDLIGSDLTDELNSFREEHWILGSDRTNEFIWRAISAGEFSVKYVYKIMFDKSLKPNEWGNVCLNHLIPKINIF